MSANTKNNKLKNITDSYIKKVNEYANYLMANEDAITQLVNLFNEKGQEYFGKDRSGYIKAYPEDVLDSFKKEIHNKADFIKKKRSDEGHNDDAPDEEVLFLNEAAFDDSFRHTIFLNITDMANPTLVDPPAGLLKDSVLQWDKVEELPSLFPDGNTIAVHLDAMTQIFFPIPTKKTSGGKRKRKTRKTQTY